MAPTSSSRMRFISILPCLLTLGQPRTIASLTGASSNWTEPDTSDDLPLEDIGEPPDERVLNVFDVDLASARHRQ